MQTAHVWTIFLWPSCLNRCLTLSLWFPHGCLVMGDQYGTSRTRDSIFWPVIFIRLHQSCHDYNQQATFLSWASAPHKNKCEFEMSNAWKSSHMHLNGILIEILLIPEGSFTLKQTLISPLAGYASISELHETLNYQSTWMCHTSLELLDAFLNLLMENLQKSNLCLCRSENFKV